MAASAAAIIVGLVLTVACKKDQSTPQPPVAGRYSLQDFGRLRWLEGSWHGRLPEGGHFYERYQLVDDSTIAMHGFPDSTFAHATDSASITLRGGTIADEGSARWVATRLESNAVDFASERNASNNFTWTRESQDRWTATLRSSDRQGRAQTTIYPMERIGQADPDPEGAARARIGVVFDPSRVEAGDSIAGMVVERIKATRTVMDSTFVGTAAFRGEIELAGSTMRHFEADAANEVCFGVDSASAARLPRWAADRRRAWFCFWNKDEAGRVLGPARTERRARIVIANFVIHRNLTDAVNAARFVRLVDDSADVLERAAKDVVGFLRGDVGFEKIRLADTVHLYLSPEGGGTRSAFPREALRKPSNWVIHSGRQTYAFAPTGHFTNLTAKAGRHFNCLEYPLASRFPDLARLPHVGVKLEPNSPKSCLESWNATFVFDTSEKPPRLVAAVYDQWEW